MGGDSGRRGWAGLQKSRGGRRVALDPRWVPPVRNLVKIVNSCLLGSLLHFVDVAKKTWFSKIYLSYSIQINTVDSGTVEHVVEIRGFSYPSIETETRSS